MGLLDGVLGPVMGGGGGNNQLLTMVMALLGDKKVGGLAGLLQQFTDSGLGDVANSWVGTGQNLPISGNQIVQALGSPQIRHMASQLGLAPDAVAGQLANLLPSVVDQLTPQGRVPDQLPKMDSLEGLLKGLLG